MGLGKPPAPTLEEAYEKAQAALAAIELPLKLDGGATVTRCFADFRLRLDTFSGRTRRHSPPFSCRSSWAAEPLSPGASMPVLRTKTSATGNAPVGDFLARVQCSTWVRH